MYIFSVLFGVFPHDAQFQILRIGGGDTKIRDTEKGVSCPCQSAYWVLSGADGFYDPQKRGEK